MKNPLLNPLVVIHELNFKEIEPQHFIDAFKVLMPKVKQEHEKIVTEAPLTYDALFEEYPEREQLSSVLALLDNINSLIQTPEIREIYNEYEPQVSLLFQEISLDNRGYNKIKEYTKTNEFHELNEIHKKSINHLLKQYEINGINLSQQNKNILQDLTSSISELMNQFDDNLKDVDAAMEQEFTKEELKGLPERCFQNAVLVKGATKEKDRIYLVSNSSGLYDDILSFCEVEKTRKKVYDEQVLVGVKDKFDNRPILKKIAKLNQQSAQLLGFKDYATLSLVDEMAKSPEEILSFIDSIALYSYEYAKKEEKEIANFGTNLLGRIPQYHDRQFIIEKMKKEQFSIDTEELRKYFPVKNVMNGLFSLLKDLYDIEFVKNKQKDVWHEDVIAYDVLDNSKNNVLMGTIYVDLYKRKFKASGAWMNPITSRHVNKDGKRLPIAYLVCNAPKDLGQEPTFEMEEVVTLFHEMGHCLHHLLTEVDIEYYSGINNVQHDAIELPSQFMENFCWNYENLKLMTSHIDTGEVLPYGEYEKMFKIKNFLSGLLLTKQTIAAEIDMRIYSNPDCDPMTVEKEVKEKWKLETSNPKRFTLPSFTHIFSGGYNAGYYAYHWAEVLSADAFAALNESGNTVSEQKEAAKLFRKTILARGGAYDMADNFLEFRGRKPEVKYLLESWGLLSEGHVTKLKK